nr:NAD(P)-dependent oxidoreductase [Rhizobium sp. SSA_523]
MITGGTGFVGLASAEALLKAGHEVTLFASTGLADPFRDAPELAGASLVLGDICSEADLSRAIAAARPQSVLHLAAMTPNVDAEREMAARIIAVNIGGTATLMKMLAQAEDLSRIVCASSVAVYGHVGLDEGSIAEDRKLDPASLYGITKVAAEGTARRMAALFGYDLRIARLGPLFGPWEHSTGVRPLLSPHAQILSHWRKGRPARLGRPLAGDWLYSRDAGLDLLGLLTGERLQHMTYNVGAGSSHTVLDWANTLSPRIGGGDAALAGPHETANVSVTMAQDRAPLCIERLVQDCGHHARSPDEAASDYADWLTRFDPPATRTSA